MKKYLLFMFEQYENNGGWCDFRGDFDTLSQAYSEIQKIQGEEGLQYFHVVNLDFGKIVMHSGNHAIPKNLLSN